MNRLKNFIPNHLWNIAATMFGLLCLGAVAIFLGKPSTDLNPSSNSYDPGGARAFATLLDRSGYHVESTDFLPSHPVKDTLVIVFGRPMSRFGGTDSESEREQDEDRERSATSYDFVQKQLEGGQPALVLTVDPNLNLDSATSPRQVFSTSGKTSPKNLDSPVTNTLAELWPFEASRGAELPTWTARPHNISDLIQGQQTLLDMNDSVANLFTLQSSKSVDTAQTGDQVGGSEVGAKLRGSKSEPKIQTPSRTQSTPGGQAQTSGGEKVSGIGASVSLGCLALNEFIDKGDNAAFLLDVVRTVAPPSKKLLFIDGAYNGARQQGVLDVLGPWATGAWNQFLVLVVVLAWSVSVRFGQPIVVRRRQWSSRQLLDGIADTMSRGRHSHWALSEIARSAHYQIRGRLGLPISTASSEVYKRLPVELATALRDLESVANYATEARALYLAQNLERELRAWLDKR